MMIMIINVINVDHRSVDVTRAVAHDVMH